MLTLLREFVSSTDMVLDYGCGKLRYTIPISRIAKIVYGVDSKEQLDRYFTVNGKKTTIPELSKQYKNIVLYTACQQEWKKKKYDKILLSHVLSTIPQEKARKQVVDDLNNVMKWDSILIACTNHRMSYFKKWDESSRVEKYNDGYFVKEPAPSYFGVINKNKLASYFDKNRFKIIKLFVEEDNTYCICKKNK